MKTFRICVWIIIFLATVFVTAFHHEIQNEPCASCEKWNLDHIGGVISYVDQPTSSSVRAVHVVLKEKSLIDNSSSTDKIIAQEKSIIKRGSRSFPLYLTYDKDAIDPSKDYVLEIYTDADGVQDTLKVVKRLVITKGYPSGGIHVNLSGF